jgi:hypothetical protein
MIPVGDPVYTHEGTVADDESAFQGDDLNVSFTLVSAHDGRVLWHFRQNADVEVDNPAELDRFLRGVVATIPPSLRVRSAATAQ